MPQMLGSAATDGWATSIDVSENHAYLADQYNGLCIFDVTDPANPFLTGHYDSEGCTEYVVVQDTCAYLADGERGLVILNISDPSHPYYLGSWTEAEYYAFTVCIADTIAYVGAISEDAVSGEPLRIISVADPTNPYLISVFPQIPSPGGNIIAAFVVDSLAFLTGSWSLTGVPSHFLITNVADPANPVLVSAMSLGEPALGVTVSGDHAYISDQSEGIRIIDIGNPATPFELGQFGISVHYGYGCAVQDTILIVPQSHEGFYIVNVSDPSNPVALFHKHSYLYTAFTVEDTMKRLYLFGWTCVSSVFHSTLMFVDVSDILTPDVHSEMNFLGSWDRGFRGPGLVTDYPYLTFGLKRDTDRFLGVVNTFNINQPQLYRFEVGTTAGPVAFVSPNVYAGHNNMVIIGDINATSFWVDTVGLPEYCNGIAINDSIAYVSCRNCLAVLNLNSNSVISTYFHGHQYAGCNGGIKAAFPYLYISFVEFYAGVIYNGFLVFDVGNPAAPSMLSEIVTQESIPWYVMVGWAKSCFLEDTLFYLCRGTAGFDIYNVSNPSAPILVLTRDTPYSCDDIHVTNDTIIVMDGRSVEAYRLIDTGVDEIRSLRYAQTTCVLEVCPDPFRTQTCISYNFESVSRESGNILRRMEIYDISGRMVKSFNDLGECSGQISWHGEDDKGRALPQGVYFVGLTVGAECHVRKVVLLR